MIAIKTVKKARVLYQLAWPEWCSHCLRSCPATPIAVFATAPAPEAANKSAAAASARRSSVEGTISDAAVNAACAERSKASDGPLGLLCLRAFSFLSETDSSKSAALGYFSQLT